MKLTLKILKRILSILKYTLNINQKSLTNFKSSAVNVTITILFVFTFHLAQTVKTRLVAFIYKQFDYKKPIRFILRWHDDALLAFQIFYEDFNFF